MRRKLIAGNWKMNKTLPEAVELAGELKKQVGNVNNVDVVLCPPFPMLFSVGEIIKDSNIKLGAQNLFWEEQGAFTGEVAAPMLASVGCQFVIVGHSERRKYFGETNQTVNRRIKAALKFGLTPILCVGETLEQREAGSMETVVTTQVKEGLADFSADEVAKMVIAYEPVWAIGTGRNATPEQAVEVHSLIRELLKSQYGADLANKFRIQYGGSVTPQNANELLQEEEIDGALVGGASLKADSFVAIIKAGELLSHA